uniref:Si:ch73-71c20.5 n=1 Tax=Neogobius melanostomus TaxID=47308 RepID=A0A8C6UMN2_9GOBI
MLQHGGLYDSSSYTDITERCASYSCTMPTHSLCPAPRPVFPAGSCSIPASVSVPCVFHVQLQTCSTEGPPKQDPKATVEEEDEEEEEGPEYIPKRKAKNPMMKIGYAWMIGLPTGILTFILAKRQVDKNRLKQLKIRRRMKQSNEGEFDRSRYQRYTGT